MERHGTYPDIALGPGRITISFEFIVEDAGGVKMVEDPFSALLANAFARSETFIVVETSSLVVRRYLAQEHFDTHGASELSPLFVGLLSETNEGMSVVCYILFGHRCCVPAVIAQSVALLRVESFVEIR